MLRQLLISAALLAAAAAQHCPAQCECGNGDEVEFTCFLPSANVTVNSQLNNYVRIDCEGGSLSCSELPSISVGGNMTVQSLTIRACALPDTLACLLELLEVTDVQWVTLDDITTPITPQQFDGLAIKKLMMFNSAAQPSIPSDVISSIQSLTSFRLCGANVSLHSHQFPHPPPLQYLELSTDNLKVIPDDAFTGLSELDMLNLWGNNVTELGENALRGLVNLQVLSLSTNNLTYIPTGLLAHTPRLRSVTIKRNRLSELGELFNGLENLEEVTISNDLELKLLGRVFNNLPSLKVLDMAECFIKTLPADLISNSTALKHLSLANNKLEDIPAGLLSDQTALEKLDFSHNSIKSVKPEFFSNLKSLTELILDWNHIQVLPNQLFTGLRRLTTVSISHNKLHTISGLAFQGASDIEKLVLAYNQLSFLRENSMAQYHNVELNSPFNSLVKLKHLDLKKNNVSYIFDDWKMVLLNLQTLDLSWNQFTELEYADIEFLGADTIVDLRHNNITTINFSMLQVVLDSDTPRTNAQILLDDNPIICDCHLHAFIETLHALESTYQVGDAKCSAPLQNYYVRDIPDNILVCQFNCTDNCECSLRPATRMLELDCQKDVSLPSPEEFGLSDSTLRLHHAPADFTTLPEHVTTLNLSGLGLVKLPFEYVPRTLKLLDLSNNKLSEIPIGLLNRNLTLRLHGNEFECDCWHADELAALISSKSDFDYDKVACTDGTPLSQIDAARLCDIYRATAVGSVLVTLGVMIAICAALLYRYSLEVRVYLFAKGWFRRWWPEEHLDASKTYDIFVSFAHKDEDFVRDCLLPKLESEFTVCVHYRDWVVGDLIPLQIARSVDESRRTVIVLSRHFLSSMWGMLEFRAAHVQAAKEGRVRVIIILLEDVSKLSMDEEMRAYLSTNTYVKWGDPWFWDKLRYALPRGVKAKDIRQERKTKEAVEKLMKGGLDVQLNREGKLINAAFVKDTV